MSEEGFYRCPECGSVETERRTRCTCGYAGGPRRAPGGAAAPQASKRRPLVGLGCGVWLLIIGAALCVFGYQEALLARVSSATPTVVRLEELEQGQRPSNAYIRIEQYIPHYEMGIVSVPKISKDDPNTRLNYLLYPIVSSSEADPRTVPLLVMVETRRYAKASDVPKAFVASGPVEGMIVNDVRGFNDEEVNLIREQFPHRDFHATVIVEEGRMPAPAWRYLALLGGGGVLVLIAIMAFVGKLRGGAAEE